VYDPKTVDEEVKKSYGFSIFKTLPNYA